MINRQFTHCTSRKWFRCEFKWLHSLHYWSAKPATRLSGIQSIYGTIMQKLFIVYKNALCLNHYNFQTINAIAFLFSTHHTTVSLYGISYFCPLDPLLMVHTNAINPRGSKIRYLSYTQRGSCCYWFVSVMQSACTIHGSYLGTHLPTHWIGHV